MFNAQINHTASTLVRYVDYDAIAGTITFWLTTATDGYRYACSPAEFEMYIAESPASAGRAFNTYFRGRAFTRVAP